MRPRKRKPKIVEKKLGKEYLGQAYLGEDRAEVDPRHRTEYSRMNTVIHELLHLIAPDLAESRIKTITGYVTFGLWKENYRRVRQ